jgi:HEPN domain-containing protein
MKDTLESQAKSLDEMATELEKAAAHAKTAAVHFRAGETPRACAHTLAVEGHVQAAKEALTQIAKRHRIAATP